MPLPVRQHTFQTTANQYFETLQTIDVGLQRQIHGLEEADIIPQGKKEVLGIDTKKGEEKPFVQGTLGGLDIGWLNSRSATVDRNMERELWTEAKRFLEDLKEKKRGDKQNGEKEDHDIGG
jgi:hypothetical protein